MDIGTARREFTGAEDSEGISVDRRVSLCTAMVLATAVIMDCPEAAVGQAIDPYAVPKSVYHSEKVLRDALANIAQMQEPELRAFTHYLAECSDNEDTDVSKHACAAALTSYHIEFGSFGLNHERPLDQLISVRSSLVERRPEEKARDVHPTGSLEDQSKELADWAIKESKIPYALEEAAHDRFRSLKSVQK